MSVPLLSTPALNHKGVTVQAILHKLFSHSTHSGRESMAVLSGNANTLDGTPVRMRAGECVYVGRIFLPTGDSTGGDTTGLPARRGANRASQDGVIHCPCSSSVT